MIHLLVAFSMVAFLPNNAPMANPSPAVYPMEDTQTIYVKKTLETALLFHRKEKYDTVVLLLGKITDAEISDPLDRKRRDRCLGEAYYHLGKYDKAAEHYRKYLYEPTKHLLRITTQSGEVIQHKMTETEIKDGMKFDTTKIKVADIEPLEDGGYTVNTADATHLLKLAISLYHIGKVEEAVSVYNTALTPLNYQDREQKYKVPLLIEFKDKNAPKRGFLAAAHAGLGMEAYKHSQTASAERELKQSLGYGLNNSPANYYLGRMLKEQGKSTEATEFFTRAAKYGNKSVVDAVRNEIPAKSGL